MRAISFYWRWVKTAFTHSIGQSDLWGGIAGTILAVVDHFWPEKQLMSSLSWQIPLWALGTVIALRLISAPYWMAKEDALSGRGTKNKQRVSLSYAGDKTIKHNNGSKHTFLYATNEGGGDAAGTQVKIEEARFRRDGSDIWEGTSIVSRTNMSWGFLPDGDPQKYSTVQLAPGSEPVDFVSGPHNFQLQDGSMQLGFAN